MQKTNVNRKSQRPVPYPRTRRPDRAKMMTSARAGRLYPAAFIPLMPMDSIVSNGGGASTWTVTAKMEETEKLLSNGVNMRMHAYFVSLAALERFDGVESVSYAWAEREGSEPIVEKYSVDTAEKGDFYKAFGEHIVDASDVNSLYIEAYNQVVNHRRALVSESLAVRAVSDHSLARSLWGQTAIARIVPTFDAALIEGEFDLNGAGTAPVRGIGVRGGTTPDIADPTYFREANGDFGPFVYKTNTNNDAEAEQVVIETDGIGTPRVFAELAGAGLTVSLATIDQAKKVKAFAELRQSFSGNDDELVDLLMRGFPMPNSMYREPIHLGSAAGSFVTQQRFATDAANLDTYVSNGVVRATMPIRLPVQPTGGVVVLMYEIVPEPVFDRQCDLFLRSNVDDYPNALRDHLDIQQVDVVPNRFVDALHSVPDGTFGYAPMNYDWIRQRDRVGGRFLRSLIADASAEDQQHIWSVRTVDPTLNEDSFLVPEDLAHNVFLDTESDPFIIQSVHDFTVEGITQFGPALFESSGDYLAVAEIAPTDTVVPA